MKKILVFLMILSLLAFGCATSAPTQTTNPDAVAPNTAENSQVSSSSVEEDTMVSDSEESKDASSSDSLLTEEPIAQAASESKVKEFEMISQKFEFSPSTITVNEGDTVLLHIVSTDIAHGIGIPAFGVSEFLPAGKTVDVEFIADTKGEFPFICNVPCGSGHRNMKGLVVVK